MTINPVLGKTTQQIHVFHVRYKTLKGFDDGLLTGMTLMTFKKHLIRLTMTYF